MQATHPLSLLLVVLLAFWTPGGQCCAAAVAEAPAPAETEPLPPCHPQPTETPAPCDSDCDDTCDCTPLMRSACQSDRAPTATPAPSQPQPPAMTAALLPASMQPHTFAIRAVHPLVDAAPPPAAAPSSLVALNCQLTL